MIPRIYWVGAVASSVNVDAQATVSLDFAAIGAPKVRRDAKGRLSSVYRLRWLIIQRIGPNTVGGAVLDEIRLGGATGQPARHVSGIPFYSGSSPAPIDTDLCEWNPRTLSVTFTCRSSVASTFQVAAAVEDLGPEAGFDGSQMEGTHAADVG